MTVDHVNTHDICHECFHDRHPDFCKANYHGLVTVDGNEVDAVVRRPPSTLTEAVRCCFCARYTRLELVEEAPADEVPRHRKDEAWLQSAGIKPTDLYVPDDEAPDDPRVVTPQ